MDARNNIATDLFYKIRSRFRGLKLGTETGEITINPEEARFFDFDYMEGENPIGHISISLAEPNSMKVYFSRGITEPMDTKQKSNWYQFLRELRQFSKRRLLAFDPRDITKDNLDKRDYVFLSQNANKPQQQSPNTIQKPVGESVMNESNMYGSRTISYQKLMDTRLIIKHNQAVMDDTQPGARTRHISALFVENQDGERFKYPFIHLAGARAMQRHVANSGLPYDDLGKSIIRMSEEIAQLKSFGNYVVRNDLMNSENNSIVERSSSYLNQLRETISKLAKQGYYESYREKFQAQDSLEIPQDVVEDFVEKFTVKNFKEDIKSVFPVLYRLMQENNSIGYDDIVAMTQTEEQTNEDIEVDETEDAIDPFGQFESWVMGLGEQSAIDSENAEEQAQAVKELQELVGQHFPAGVDGTNAIESLKGIIEDPVLYQQIQAASKEDPDSCVRPLVKQWLEQKAPEVLDQLDFGDMEEPEAAPAAEEPAAEPAAVPTSQPQMSDVDLEQQHPKKIDTRELAEFIQSFYDRDSGTFPKGPEGVCTMVGKKFGEQAEQVARKFVERMAPQQASPELQELARIKQLSGLQSEDANVTELDYKSFSGSDELAELRDSIDKNILVSVAFVKKDGTVKHMGVKKNLSSYVPSTREKTDKQLNVEQNNDIKKVIDINAYIKSLKELKAAGMEEEQAKAEAAKKAWRSINLQNVLGFMVRGKFVDLRDENEIRQRFGDEIYNSVTPAMKSALAQSQQATESFDMGVDEAKAGADNFTADDIHELEILNDLNEIKSRALELIMAPGKRPMKPEKINYFKEKIGMMTSKSHVIKLMYDLLLSGEGIGVIGSRNSMGSSNYRQRFGDSMEHEAVDELARIKDLSGIAKGLGF
jgi:hypothetical protein